MLPLKNSIRARRVSQIIAFQWKRCYIWGRDKSSNLRQKRWINSLIQDIPEMCATNEMKHGYAPQVVNKH